MNWNQWFGILTIGCFLILPGLLHVGTMARGQCGAPAKYPPSLTLSLDDLESRRVELDARLRCELFRLSDVHALIALVRRLDLTADQLQSSGDSRELIDVYSTDSETLLEVHPVFAPRLRCQIQVAACERGWQLQIDWSDLNRIKRRLSFEIDPKNRHVSFAGTSKRWRNCDFRILLANRVQLVVMLQDGCARIVVSNGHLMKEISLGLTASVHDLETTLPASPEDLFSVAAIGDQLYFLLPGEAPKDPFAEGSSDDWARDWNYLSQRFDGALRDSHRSFFEAYSAFSKLDDASRALDLAQDRELSDARSASLLQLQQHVLQLHAELLSIEARLVSIKAEATRNAWQRATLRQYEILDAEIATLSNSKHLHAN